MSASLMCLLVVAVVMPVLWLLLGNFGLVNSYAWGDMIRSWGATNLRTHFEGVGGKSRSPCWLHKHSLMQMYKTSQGLQACVKAIRSLLILIMFV